MYRYILFDLDGTLTDPKLGICTCVQYALAAMGIEEPDIDKLEPFIGPPLKDSFMDFYNMSEEEAEKAIVKYRERFSSVGKFENEVYTGIAELLSDLKKKGRILAVASSKPEVFVNDILKHFDIAKYFDVVVGSELDGQRSSKEEVIDETIKRLFPDSEPEYEDIVMIGDRKFDIEASLAKGIRNIGVSYGYGSREELDEAGAEKIVNTVVGLRAALLPMVGEGQSAYQRRTDNSIASNPQPALGANRTSLDYKEMSKEAGKKSFANLWTIVGPILMYAVGSKVAEIAILLFAGSIIDQQKLMDNLDVYSAVFRVIGSVIVAAFLFKTFLYIEKKEKQKEQPELLFKLEPLVLGISIVLLGIGVNGFLIFSSQLTETMMASSSAAGVSQTAATTVDVKTLMPLGLVVLLYGLILPVVEEFIFTGFSYRGAKKFVKPELAWICIAVIYGLFQNDKTNIGCNFIIYAAILFSFTKYPKIWFAMLVHVIVASVACLQSYHQTIGAILSSRIVTSLFIALGFTGLIVISIWDRKKNASLDIK